MTNVAVPCSRALRAAASRGWTRRMEAAPLRPWASFPTDPASPARTASRRASAVALNAASARSFRTRSVPLGLTRVASGSDCHIRVRFGATGLAQAPHLHYEFRVNGVHRNPQTVRLPSSQPVPEKHLAKFQLATAPVLAQLDLLTQDTQVALVETE